MLRWFMEQSRANSFITRSSTCRVAHGRPYVFLDIIHQFLSNHLIHASTWLYTASRSNVSCTKPGQNTNYIDRQMFVVRPSRWRRNWRFSELKWDLSLRRVLVTVFRSRQSAFAVLLKSRAHLLGINNGCCCGGPWYRWDSSATGCLKRDMYTKKEDPINKSFYVQI